MAADGVGGTLVAYRGRMNVLAIGNTHITYLMAECPSRWGQVDAPNSFVSGEKFGVSPPGPFIDGCS